MIFFLCHRVHILSLHFWSIQILGNQLDIEHLVGTQKNCWNSLTKKKKKKKKEEVCVWGLFVSWKHILQYQSDWKHFVFHGKTYTPLWFLNYFFMRRMGLLGLTFYRFSVSRCKFLQKSYNNGKLNPKITSTPTNTEQYCNWLKWRSKSLWWKWDFLLVIQISFIKNVTFKKKIFFFSKHVRYSALISCQPGWSYLPTPPLGQDMTQGQFLSGV